MTTIPPYVLSDSDAGRMQAAAAFRAKVSEMDRAERARWYQDHPLDEYRDPEMLPPQQKIRFAEQLIRREHRVLDDDWMFWGNLADHLNHIAHVPDKTGQKDSDWREFNRAQDMAAGYIRMSAAAAAARSGS